MSNFDEINLQKCLNKEIIKFSWKCFVKNFETMFQVLSFMEV